jgi:hypothetical protein
LIHALRARFNHQFTSAAYARLMELLEERCGVKVGFRVAETPIFVTLAMMEEMAKTGAELALRLVGDQSYLAAARRAIPVDYAVAGETEHPNFLTADFALVRDGDGKLAPRLVEIQAFPSVYGYQAELCRAYREAFGLDGWPGDGLGFFLSGLDEDAYWELLRRTIVDGLDPESVVLTEFDPIHQKTRPDFEVTARRLGIEVVDIRELVAEGDRLHYRNGSGRMVPIERIYNRAIADELMARGVRLPFDLTRAWDVEWAGHPNWYFLISKYSIPWLARSEAGNPVVPPAVFLNDFLEGDGRAELERAGVRLPIGCGGGTVYGDLLLKPLFSFAGKGIQFDPTQEELEAIPPSERGGFLLQQRMRFEPTIETPHGLTQAEIRILYLWPDDGPLTAGVDHNRDQEWVGASAGFFPLN